MEDKTKNTLADSDNIIKELQKCFQLARLCKDILYEDFYNKKLSQIMRTK